MSRYEQKVNKGSSPIIIIGVLLLAVLIAWLFFWDQQDDVIEVKTIDIPKKNTVLESEIADPLVLDAEPVVSIVESDVIAEEGLSNKVTLPELEASDEFFRQEMSFVAKELSSWFRAKDIIKKYIVIINDLSQNQIMFKHRAFLKPPGKIVVKEDAQGLYLTKQSYKRYDGLASAMTAIDVEKGLQLYLKFKPLFETVYREFAYPADYRLEDIFLKAAASVIKSPVIEGRVALVRHSVRYKFADKKLELLNDVEKQMIRMGPENTRKIQAKLRMLVQALVVVTE